jgi:ATP adenylyltransferase
MAFQQDGDRLERLWAPHRLAYVSTTTDADGCPFCMIPTLPEEESLVVARGEYVYAVLNLHPYNPGHLMVLPYRHVADLEALTIDEEAELARYTREAVVAIRSTSRPHGFNVGLNLGGSAGGSLSDHLHQHVVPRWGGDANFMTVTAGTKVMPQLLEETRHLLKAAWPA